MAPQRDFSGEDLSSVLEGINEEFPQEEPKKKSKKGKIIGGIVAVALIGSAAGLYVVGSNQESVEQEQVAQKKSVEMQLVNTEQVAWADNMCSIVSRWDSEDDLNKMGEPKSEDGFNSTEARDRLTKLLYSNAGKLRDRAQEVRDSVASSYEQAASSESETVITDNNRKVGDEPNVRVVTASETVASEIEDFAKAMEAMAFDLSGKADYDAYGIRDTIAMIKSTFPSMSENLRKNISKEMNDSLFDNLVTMEKVSQLEQCSDSFVNSGNLMKDNSSFLEEQSTIRNFVNYKRCEDYLSHSPNPGNINVDICKELMDSTTVDNNHPGYSMDIDTHDQDRAIPASVSINESESPSSPPSSDSEENKSDAPDSPEESQPQEAESPAPR